MQRGQRGNAAGERLEQGAYPRPPGSPEKAFGVENDAQRVEVEVQ